ncbi:MAG: ABC transporter ATP-binding protein [bacterium]
MNNLIVLEQIHKSYYMDGRELPVLKGITVEISQGDIIAIVGRSGSGKSTLLNILGALDRPTKGSYFFKNKNINIHSDSELSQFRNQKIGFIFQFHHLLPEFSAIENTMMPQLMARKDRKEAFMKAERLLDEVGLCNRKSHLPCQLSGGEQQRVAIARALINDPELLLADEPTGNLDSKTSEAVFNLMLQLNRSRGITMIIVTHNPYLANSASQIFELVDGIFIV